MNRISRHISYLLITCRKVTIPGLCSLSANYEHATFDSIDGVFYPGKLRISVSRTKKDNSRLLSDSLRRRLNLDHDEAEQLLEEFVRNVKSRLNEKHYCRLEGVGYLFTDSRGSLFLKDTLWKTLHSSKALQRKC